MTYFQLPTDAYQEITTVLVPYTVAINGNLLLQCCVGMNHHDSQIALLSFVYEALTSA